MSKWKNIERKQLNAQTVQYRTAREKEQDVVGLSADEGASYEGTKLAAASIHGSNVWITPSHSNGWRLRVSLGQLNKLVY